MRVSSTGGRESPGTPGRGNRPQGAVGLFVGGAARRTGGPAVCLCKLADVYDNLTDAAQLPAPKQATTLSNAKRYLAVFRPNLPEEAKAAFALVEKRLRQTEKRLTT